MPDILSGASRHSIIARAPPDTGIALPARLHSCLASQLCRVHEIIAAFCHSWLQVSAAVKAADASLLTAVRGYLAAASRLQYSLDDAMSDTLQKEFIAARKADTNFSPDTFHNRLSVRLGQNLLSTASFCVAWTMTPSRHPATNGGGTGILLGVASNMALLARHAVSVLVQVALDVPWSGCITMFGTSCCNAMKYMPPGTAVCLQVARLAALSFGESGLSEERWRYALGLESAREARLRVV